MKYIIKKKGVASLEIKDKICMQQATSTITRTLSSSTNVNGLVLIHVV